MELLRNRLVKALEVMDPRRCRAMSFGLLVEFPLSEDIVNKRTKPSEWEIAGLLYRRSRSSQRQCRAARVACCRAGVASAEPVVGQAVWADPQSRTFGRLEWFELGVSARSRGAEVKRFNGEFWWGVER